VDLRMGTGACLTNAAPRTRELQRPPNAAVHLEYKRGVTRRDCQLLRACDHRGAVYHHRACPGDAVAWALGFVDAVESTTHFVGNQIVDVVSGGETAWHEAYCRAYHRMRATDSSPAVDYVVNLRYLDRMEARNGTWKISDRLVVHDGVRRDVVGDTGETDSAYFPGGLFPDDASYHRSRPWSEFLAEPRPP
jgi:hypothetical protein